MGNYIDSETVEERITTTRLNGLAGVTGTELTSLLENVIARAEAMIDAHACVKYEVPLPTSQLVEEWALSISEYELYKRSSAPEVPQKIKDSYAETLKLLSKLTDGSISIPDAVFVSNAGTPVTMRSVSTSSGEALMDEESLKGF